jgi:hypothetical protein
MTCSRGRAHPDDATRLKLFTDSAGYCQNPGCSTPLFPEGFEKFPHIAEMAHIFAATDGGPRTNEKLSNEERGAYENIVLLCASCHALVDKTPEAHPPTLMATWKREHVAKIQRVFGFAKLDSRKELHNIIHQMLAENAMVHEQIGPDNDYRFNPEASEAAVWKARVKRTIIPNSFKILMICDVNSVLINKEEAIVLEKFRYHVQGLVMRHLEGLSLSNSRFPVEMKHFAE